MNRIKLAIVLAAVAASPLVAQGDTLSRQIVNAKDPSTAAIFSFLLPGLGQVYNNQPAKGAVMFATSVGGIAIAATPRLRNVCGTTTALDAFGKPYQVASCHTERNGAMFAGGLALAGATWIYSMFDAAIYAKRYNASHRVRVTVAPTTDGVVAGMSFAPP